MSYNPTQASKTRRIRDRVTQTLYGAIAPRLSRRGQAEVFSTDDVEGFRRAQRLANDCVTSVARQLQVGITEKAAASLLQAYLEDHGTRHFLHRPFAWFGEHSRFDPYDEDYDLYHPTDRALEGDDVFILDVSPILNGYTGDVGYANSLRTHAGLEQAKTFLRRLREEIPGLFASERTTDEIWKHVGQRMADAGYTVCHELYPFRVLGHRVYHVPERQMAKEPKRLNGGPMGTSWFSSQALTAFASHGFASELINPEHRGSKLGLWAIEPHLGGPGFGAKFEEILQVEEGAARWIDDDVPLVTEAESKGEITHTKV